MASLDELQNALQNAHDAGDTAAATALANEIVRQKMPWAATQVGPPQPLPIPEGPLSYLPGAAQAAVIAAGRTGNQLESGAKQALLGGLAIGKDALGLDTTGPLQGLAALDKTQRAEQPMYDALKRRFPLATGAGENLPAVALPVGQATVAGRILAPAIGNAALQFAQYGDPVDRTVRGGLGFLTGLGGGAAGEAAARAALPIPQTVGSAAQSAARAAADKLGAPMLPSQLSGSPDLARVEDALARFPGSAGVMQSFLGKQRDAVNMAAAKAIQQTEAPTQAVRDIAKSDMGAQYDAMRAQIPNGMPVNQNVLDAVNSARTALSRGSSQAPGKASAITMLEDLNDKLFASKALSPEDYSGWVSDLSAAARAAQNPQVAAQLKGVGAVMDQEARGPLNGQWQKLDQAYAALKTLNKPGVTNPQTGDVSPLKVANFLERNSTGARATSLQDIADYARSVPQLRAGSPTAERDAVTMPGALNALWRYPLAKVLTSNVMREYLANGLLANPQASGALAGAAQRAALPMVMTPAMGLLGTIPNYQ